MPNLTRYAPFDSGAGANVYEDQWREMAKHWVSDGIISSIGSAMAVSATAGMVLAVASGSCFIQGHFGALDSTANVSISTAHATLPRIDRVVLRLDTVANTISLEVLTGTANASPVAPTLTTTSATYEILLATIAVAAAASSITAPNITDGRTLITPNNGSVVIATSAPPVVAYGTATSALGSSTKYAKEDHTHGLTGTPTIPVIATAAPPVVAYGTATSALGSATKYAKEDHTHGLTGTPAIPPGTTNPIRNASMQVAQRGTSFAGTFSSTWTLDGWQAHRYGVAGATVAQVAAADTTGSQLAARVQRDSGNANTTAIMLAQSVTTAIAKHYASKQVTFSFRARAGSNYSAASGALTGTLVSGTGTDQNVLAGFTGSASAITVNATLTTSWQTFTGTATLGSITQLGVTFSGTPVGTAGANDYYEVKDVRVDEGATALVHIPKEYPADLVDAQHYVRVYGGTTNEVVATGYINTGIYGANALEFFRTFDIPMRAAPTASLTGNWEAASADGTHVVGTLTTVTYTPRSINFVVYRSSGAAVSTNRSGSQLRATDTSARFVVTAEI